MGEGGSLFRTVGLRGKRRRLRDWTYGKEREHEGTGGLGGVVQTLSVFNTT